MMNKRIIGIFLILCICLSCAVTALANDKLPFTDEQEIMELLGLSKRVYYDDKKLYQTPEADVFTNKSSVYVMRTYANAGKAQFKIIPRVSSLYHLGDALRVSVYNSRFQLAPSMENRKLQNPKEYIVPVTTFPPRGEKEILISMPTPKDGVYKYYVLVEAIGQVSYKVQTNNMDALKISALKQDEIEQLKEAFPNNKMFVIDGIKIHWKQYFDQVLPNYELLATSEDKDFDAVLGDRKDPYGGTFFAAAYRNTKNKKIVIAYRGSDEEEELSFKKSEGKSYTLLDNYPNQLKYAKDFYNGICSKFDTTHGITLTGHSLGGMLADGVSIQLGVSSLSFNAPTAWVIDNVYTQYKDIQNFEGINRVRFQSVLSDKFSFINGYVVGNNALKWNYDKRKTNNTGVSTHSLASIVKYQNGVFSLMESSETGVQNNVVAFDNVLLDTSGDDYIACPAAETIVLSGGNDEIYEKDYSSIPGQPTGLLKEKMKETYKRRVILYPALGAQIKTITNDSEEVSYELVIASDDLSKWEWFPTGHLIPSYKENGDYRPYLELVLSKDGDSRSGIIIRTAGNVTIKNMTE